MFDMAKTLFIARNAGNLKIKPIDSEKIKLNSNGDFKIEHGNPESECKVEENMLLLNDHSEAVDFEYTKYIKEENVETFDYEKKELVSSKTNSVYESTVGNSTNILRNLKDLSVELNDSENVKTNLSENWHCKIAPEEIQVKHENCDEDKFEGMACNNNSLLAHINVMKYIEEKNIETYYEKKGLASCKTNSVYESTLGSHMKILRNLKDLGVKPNDNENMKTNLGESWHLKIAPEEIQVKHDNSDEDKFDNMTCNNPLLTHINVMGYIEEKNIETDYEKKELASCKSNSVYESTVGSHTKILRNLKDLGVEHNDNENLKTNLSENEGKHKNSDEDKFEGMTCNKPLMTHINVLIYKCRICEKEFSRKNYINQHLKIHLIEKNYKCNTCAKAFSTRNGLSTHMFIHTGEKKHTCEICGKTFLQKAHLRSHLRIHTIEEKKYKCQICEKTFSRTDYLNQHLKIHNNFSSERKYKCNICAKTLTSKRNLKVHTFIHTGEVKYTCEFCGKTFYRNSQLKTHLVIHTGEKKYKCEICDNTFSQKSHLKSHLLIHTEEKKYKCEICEKAFLRSATLKTHLLTHTEQKYKCKICEKIVLQGALKTHLLIHKKVKKRKYLIYPLPVGTSYLVIYTG